MLPLCCCCCCRRRVCVCMCGKFTAPRWAQRRWKEVVWELLLIPSNPIMVCCGDDTRRRDDSDEQCARQRRTGRWWWAHGCFPNKYIIALYNDDVSLHSLRICECGCVCKYLYVCVPRFNHYINMCYIYTLIAHTNLVGDDASHWTYIRTFALYRVVHACVCLTCEFIFRINSLHLVRLYTTACFQHHHNCLLARQPGFVSWDKLRHTHASLTAPHTHTRTYGPTHARTQKHTRRLAGLIMFREICTRLGAIQSEHNHQS